MANFEIVSASRSPLSPIERSVAQWDRGSGGSGGSVSQDQKMVPRVSVITGIEVGLQFANNGTSRSPGGVWRGGFHPSAYHTKEDLRIVKEEAQKVREARFH